MLNTNPTYQYVSFLGQLLTMRYLVKEIEIRKGNQIAKERKKGDNS